MTDTCSPRAVGERLAWGNFEARGFCAARHSYSEIAGEGLWAPRHVRC